MNKLYVGSYGTLAVITGLTFKLRPAPDTSTTVALSAKQDDLLLAFAGRVIASELQPASIFLTRRLVADLSGLSEGNDTLLIRFIDSEAAVRYQSDWIKREIGDGFDLAVLFDDEAETLWQRVADIDVCAANAVRISVPVSRVDSMLATLTIAGCRVAVDLGLGTIRVAFDQDENNAVETINDMRSRAVELGGTLFVERAASVVRQQVDAFGDAGYASGLMKSVKAKFDPESVLNPGRFVAGI
jgi:glycolate oxidase FAD binding subunit